MNAQDLYALKLSLIKAQERLGPIKARKIEERQNRMPSWDDFNLTNQFDKLTDEELIELEDAYIAFIADPRPYQLDKLLEEIADCINVLEGIAYQAMKRFREE